MNEAVIISGVRTAQGKFAGSLKGFSAPQLGSIVIKEAVKKAKEGLGEDADFEEVLKGSLKALAR